jgi:hypothetical protein
VPLSLTLVDDVLLGHGNDVWAHRITTGGFAPLGTRINTKAVAATSRTLFVSEDNAIRSYSRPTWDSIGPPSLFVWGDNDGGSRLEPRVLTVESDSLYYWEEGLTVASVPEPSVSQLVVAAIATIAVLGRARSRRARTPGAATGARASVPNPGGAEPSAAANGRAGHRRPA